MNSCGIATPETQTLRLAAGSSGAAEAATEGVRRFSSSGAAEVAADGMRRFSSSGGCSARSDAATASAPSASRAVAIFFSSQ